MAVSTGMGASASGRLVGVGVGPGDPELLTARALRVLRESDRVFGPSIAPDAMGRAESIVREADPSIEVERLVFSINGDKAEQSRAHRIAASLVVECIDEGADVAFVTLGDPNVYTTFSHLADAVRVARPEAAISTVPGIMAFQDLAARAGVVVLDGAERLILVSAVHGVEQLGGALGDPDAAIVIYKGGRHLPEVAKLLADSGRLDGSVVGELLGLPGERMGPVSAHAGRPATYLATVIVPPVRPKIEGP